MRKAIKAIISSHNRRYPFTHKLVDLLMLVTGIGEILPVTPFPLENLDPYAVEFRYNFGTPLTDAERLQVRDSVAILREHILTRILALEACNPAP